MKKTLARRTTHQNIASFLLLLRTALLAFLLGTGGISLGLAQQEPDPGTDTDQVGPSAVKFGSIVPIVQENGFISLSVDGLGTTTSSGLLQVQKPAGATVRGAYLLAASTGFSGRRLNNGDVKINVVNNVNWDMSTPSSISSWNHFANVTAIVKPIIDAAGPGIINLTITEVSSLGIDGEVLAVIFDDPTQTTANTVALLFGAQAIAGDTFVISFAEPIDKTNPSLVLDMSLGISFGFQPSGQVSLVDVNGQRLTSSAGGQDDGQSANGALLTVGGIGDSNANPPPFANASGGTRTDDELYNLIPFVPNGATTINVFTRNPSRDDNIFFGAFFLKGATAIVGEGILLTPLEAVNPVNTTHTVTATVLNNAGQPVAGRVVTVTVVSGPHAGLTGQATTDANGEATFTYTGTVGGTDEIQASFVDSQGRIVPSTISIKEWVLPVNRPPTIRCPDPVTVECSAADTTITLTAEVEDADGDALIVKWDVNGDGTIEQTDTVPAGADVPFTFAYPVGSTVVKVTVENGSEAVTCPTVVTVRDTTAPTITCPANMIVPTDPGQCSAVVSYQPVAEDRCSAVVVTCNPPSGSTFEKGNTLVTCTARDNPGNSASCSFTVTVNDTEKPTISCPDNVTVSTAPGQCSAMVRYSVLAAADNCPGVTSSCSPESGSTFPKGTTTVTCTATDASGNTADCSFNVTVVDNEPPAIACPANITTGTDPGQCSAVVSYPMPNATDNCPGVTASCSPASGSTFPKGTTAVTCTATDSSANTASCAFVVIVNDTENPVISCPPDVTANTDPGQCSAIVDPGTATATDNCPGVTVTGARSDGQPLDAPYPKGVTTITWTATDAANNTSSCKQTITVRDNERPTITCPPGVTVLFGSVPAPATSTAEFAAQGGTISDNCDPNPTVTSSDSSAGVCPTVITRTYTVTDSSGNASTCQQTITVINLFAGDGIVWHQPLARNGASHDTDPSAGGTLKYRFQLGSTIPIQIHVEGCSGDVTENANVMGRVEVFGDVNCDGVADGNPVTIDYNGVGEAGGVMDKIGPHLKYNLDTKKLPQTSRCYILQVTVTDVSTGESRSERVPLQAK